MNESCVGWQNLVFLMTATRSEQHAIHQDVPKSCTHVALLTNSRLALVNCQCLVQLFLLIAIQRDSCSIHSLVLPMRLYGDSDDKGDSIHELPMFPFTV